MKYIKDLELAKHRISDIELCCQLLFNDTRIKERQICIDKLECNRPVVVFIFHFISIVQEHSSYDDYINQLISWQQWLKNHSQSHNAWLIIQEMKFKVNLLWMIIGNIIKSHVLHRWVHCVKGILKIHQLLCCGFVVC